MAEAPPWLNAISQNTGMLPVKGQMTYKDPVTGLEYKIKVKDPSAGRFRRKKKKKERSVSDCYEYLDRPLPTVPRNAGSRTTDDIEPLELDSNSDFEDPVYQPFPAVEDQGLVDGAPKPGQRVTCSGPENRAPVYGNVNPDDRWSPAAVGDAPEPMYDSLPESNCLGDSDNDSYGKESDEVYVRLKAVQKQQMMLKDCPTSE
ncbi:uncharacterized protein LOC119736236 [Patiria miniata]|uniref:Uncharacterized protein n=1 Tax=Patiria miniata TaxID=46514 RepID=A0A914AS51_PATMI|nr:uncharacterized protein LOC119736236 [Patiria miniata]